MNINIVLSVAALLLLHIPRPAHALRALHHALSLDCVAAFVRADDEAMRARFAWHAATLEAHAPRTARWLAALGITHDMYLIEWCVCVFVLF
jgi:hypothetical protein